MAWRLVPHGAQAVGEGPSPGRQEGATQEAQDALVGRRGNRGAPHGEPGQGTRWDVHVNTASRGGVVHLTETVATISP